MNNALARALAALLISFADTVIVYVISLLINHRMSSHYLVITFTVLFFFVLWLLDGLSRGKGE